MNLKTTQVALALATASALAHAQSDITIYGVVDAYAGQVKNTGGTLPQGSIESVNSGGMTTSYLGFRGAEDLGSGNKALFSLESYLRADTGQIGRNDADPFWGRLAIVGLEGGWGRFTLGRHVTSYSLITTNFTPFVGSTTLSPAFANVFKGNVQGDTRFNNAVRYATPSFGGLVGDALYSLGEENASGTPNAGRGRAWEIALRYSLNQLSLAAATRQIDLNTNNNGREQSAYVVAAMYDFGFAKLNAQYHDSKERFTNSSLDVKRHVYEVGATVPIGAGALLASFAHSVIPDASATTPDRRKTFSIGYDHNLSKRTDLYAAYYDDEQENPRIEQRIIALGIRHRF